MKRSAARILHEYGPFPGVDQVHGVTFDGQNIWFAAGDTLPRIRSDVRLRRQGWEGSVFNGRSVP